MVQRQVDFNRKKCRAMNKVKIQDAIIGLGKDKDPLFGSVQYERPAKTNTIVTVQTDNKTVQIPLNQIEIIIFKLDDETFGFIFKNQCFYNQSGFKDWDEKTKRLASHELERNF